MHRRKLNIDPDTSKCRTTKVGAVIPGTTQEMYYCSIDNGDCKYARRFGWDHVCKHPENASFAASDELDDDLNAVDSMAASVDTDQMLT